MTSREFETMCLNELSDMGVIVERLVHLRQDEIEAYVLEGGYEPARIRMVLNGGKVDMYYK